MTANLNVFPSPENFRVGVSSNEGSAAPVTALLAEDSTTLLAEDGTILLPE